MGRLFGTDGIRGVANSELSCELAFKVGQCGALALTSEVHKPRIIIGRDTRLSGKMLLSALTAGICSVGGEVLDAGVVPTPGVAFLTREYDADAGVVISASHNSYEYNGIKWFNSEGKKLPDATEDIIESMIKGEIPLPELPKGAGVGSAVRAYKAGSDYLEKLVSCAGGELSGLKIVVDCANGASSEFAPALFERLGAKVYAMHNMPDGMNINAKCGSTHPESMFRKVVELGADIGLAFDGDADRLIAADEFGVPVDGDKIMSICALDMKARGALKQDTLVVTVMSNLGMKLTMRENGIRTVETQVGDRYVLENMLENGYNLGGEQSGHVIFLDKNSTGDGMLTALELLGAVKRGGGRLSALSRSVKIFPQVMVNVEVANDKKYLYKENAGIIERIAQAEAKLGDKGRVLVRTSGTEPLVRIMIEGEDEALINSEAIAIAKLVQSAFDGHIR